MAVHMHCEAEGGVRVAALASPVVLEALQVASSLHRHCICERKPALSCNI